MTPTLFLHGALDGPEMWSGLAGCVPDTSYTPDLDLGTRAIHGWDGRGLAARIVEFLDKLAVEKASLIGHSIGGRVALEVAIVEPARVASLVLLSPSGTSAANQEFEAYIADEVSLVEAGLLSEALALSLRFWVDGPARHAPSGLAAVREHYAERMTPLLGAPSPTTAEPRLVWPLEPNLGRVACPTLVLIGDADASIHVDWAHTLAERVPDCELVTIPDAGHMLVAEAEERIEPHIRSFLSFASG